MPLKFLNRSENIDIDPLGFQNLSPIIPLKGGTNSIAFQVGKEIFRFPKSETVWKNQQQEAKLLSFLRMYMPRKWKNKIPNITCDAKKGYPFTRHPYIIGKTCNQGGEESVFYSDLSPKKQLKMAKELADFLSYLHQIPFSNSPPCPKRMDCTIKR